VRSSEPLVARLHVDLKRQASALCAMRWSVHRDPLAHRRDPMPCRTRTRRSPGSTRRPFAHPRS